MGFVEGQNVIWEHRWAEFHIDRLPALAADLVSRKVDVIVPVGGPASALAAKNATSTVPIVFTDIGDPIGLGLVSSGACRLWWRPWALHRGPRSDSAEVRHVSSAGASGATHLFFSR